MTWLRLDDGFAEHPKIDALTDGAFRLHVAGLAYCCRNRTDGKVPASIAARLTRTARNKHLDELVAAGLWSIVDGGYSIKNYLKFNPSRSEVEAKIAKRAEAGKKGAQKRWQKDADPMANGMANAMANAEQVVMPPSHPIPSPSKEVSSISDSTRAVDNSTEDERVAAALDIVAAQRVAQVANVRSKAALTRTILANLRAEEALDDEAGRLLHDYPNLTAAQLASCLNGESTLLRHMPRKAAND